MLKSILFFLAIWSLLYFIQEYIKKLSFYDKMFLWKTFWNIIAITFFCSLAVYGFVYFF